jgi:dTDP-4-dehydrorhamnose 3,5-epimerase
MDKINFISGVELTLLKKIEHPLGDVFHGMKSSDKGFAGFQEAYFSTVKYDVIKPWKKHLQMTLNLVVPIGEIRFVLYDDRKESSTKEQYMDIKLSLENYYRLTVPPGIWVGFKGMGNSTNLLLNIANFDHNPNEMERLDLDAIQFNWEEK